MKNRIRIISIMGFSSILLLFVVVGIGYFLNYRKYNYIDFYRVGQNFMSIEHYFHSHGEYPDSLEEIDLSTFIENERYGIVNTYKDPFTDDKKFLIYSPIRINGKNRDFVVYSRGPDMDDDNLEAINNFNQGKTSKFSFKRVNDKSILRNFLNGDLIVHYPHLAVDTFNVMRIK